VRGRRRFTRRFAKRSVAWTDGLNTFDDASGVSSRLLSFTALPGSVNTWFVSFAMTAASDLMLHGGEDAVLTRTVGRLAFLEGRKNAGAGLAAFGFQLRLVLAQVDLDPTTGLSGPRQWCSAGGLSSDDILWMKDTVVSPTAIGGAGAGYDLLGGSLYPWVEFDIKVKRKIQVDRPVTLSLMTVLPGGTTGADMRMLGGARILLMRPR